MKIFLLIFLLPVFAYGQGDQAIIKVPIDASGKTEKAILHLPDDYSSTSTRYPIMVFLHGMGEGGPNPATIYNSSSAGGPAYYIAQKTFPSSFVNPADGKSYKYIIVSPQSTNGWSTLAAQLEYVLTYLVKTYRVDESRVYLTGLSAGGEGITEYVGKLDANGVKVNATHKIAAVIPMSAVMNAAHSLLLATSILTGNIHIWGFGSPTDTHGANTLNLIGLLNTLKGGDGEKTAYAGGHCCWGQFYNPNFKQDGMNIYQWALQYTQGVSPTPPPPTIPVANAGPDQTITLPTSQVTLNGTASKVTGGTIVKHAWLEQSGPSKAKITGAASSATTVTGLAAGTYVFQLTITDNTGKTGTATVKVTVKAPPPTIPVANAGPDQTITLPTSQVTLNGTASKVTGGTIVKHAWLEQSGPSKAKITGAASSATTVTGLAAGTYVFQLTITDNTGKIGTATVKVTVKAAVSAPPPVVSQTLPGTIQAESYSAMSGIQKQGTADVGGGWNVGWIDKGDWMDYTVNVATAGAYMVNFRVAAATSGSGFQLRSASGAVLATMTLPSTGDYQKFQVVTANITLPAGAQTLRVVCTSTAHYNLNWMQFTKVPVIPGKIEAENYSAMLAILTQTTSDAGGGLNVGWIDRGNWMDYMVEVASAGAYTVSFRVAAPYTGASFQLRSSSGTVLATVSPRITGGFQKWETVTANVTLPAGVQTLRVYSTATLQWNLNWIQFARGSSAAAIQTTAVSGASNQKQLSTEPEADADSSNTTSSFALYPNPIQGQFMIQLNNGYMGNMRVQIVDVAGVIRQTYNYDKNQSSMQLTLSAGNLPAGTYFVRVQIGAWSSGAKKIIKL